MRRQAGIEKLLSHRLRGFSDVEHSPSALRSATSAPVPYLEVDTRVTGDGAIYIYHDSSAGADVAGNCRFAEASSADVGRLRFVNGEPLLSLDAALGFFAEHAAANRHLCLDIKDYGFEREHLDAVRRAGLEDQAVFVSWIPQALIRLHELGSQSPLVLSHWNLMGLGRPGRVVSRLIERRMFRAGPYVIIGKRMAAAPLGALAHGYQHCLLCRELPDPLLEILPAGRGGICVHLAAVCERLSDYCEQAQALGLHRQRYATVSPVRPGSGDRCGLLRRREGGRG